MLAPEKQHLGLRCVDQRRILLQKEAVKMISEELNEWLRSGDLGLSSKAIASKMTGIYFVREEMRGLSHPSDPFDFKTCMDLLIAVPEFKDRLDEMKEVSPIWKTLVENWGELEQLLLEESAIGPVAPKLYNRMKELGC